jgi:hypothetical protein
MDDRRDPLIATVNGVKVPSIPSFSTLPTKQKNYVQPNPLTKHEMGSTQPKKTKLDPAQPTWSHN